MLRTALQPRWLAMLALALVLASVFAALGEWQLGRSRERAADEAPASSSSAVAVLQDVAQPQTTFSGTLLDRPIQVTGRFDGATLLVTDRVLDGRAGSWVLDRLVVETDEGEATLPVVRGFLPEGASTPAAPGGTVTLTGRLEPSEAATGADDPTTVPAVSSADLLNRWGQPIYTGFLITDEPLPVGTDLQALPAPEPDDGGFALLNLSYALQWWAFALFAVFIWWRLVRDAHLSALEEGTEAEEGPDGGVAEPGDNGATDDAPAPDPARGAAT